MTVCRHCATTWTGLRIAHCAECHATFTTPANFDRHRAGRKVNGRSLPSGECHSPDVCGLVLNERGQWSMPGRPDDLGAVSA